MMSGGSKTILLENKQNKVILQGLLNKKNPRADRIHL